MKRKSWDRYFLDMAALTATRSTCDRAQVGCVIVKNKRVISTGYNGSLPGQKHCDEAGHLMIKGHCCRVIHAEMSAVLEAAKRGVSVDGATAYITHNPCFNCWKAMRATGIYDFKFTKLYKDNELVKLIERLTEEKYRVGNYGDNVWGLVHNY